MSETEIIFLVRESPEDGYEARACGIPFSRRNADILRGTI
jgi:hypothetical protein